MILQAGDVAPDFLVKDHLNRDTTIRQFRGKRVVLFFYPKADTPGCTIESCGFKELYPKFQERGIEILGCSFDTVDENAAFAKKFDLPYPLLCDVDREIGLAYGACDDAKAATAKRISYLIDPQGKIKKAYATVKPAEHPAEVLADA